LGVGDYTERTRATSVVGLGNVKDIQIRASGKDKNVQVGGSIVNLNSGKGEFLLKAAVYDTKGSEIKVSKDKRITLTGNIYQKFELNFNWKDSLLWSHDNPVLYDLKLFLQKNSQVLDESFKVKLFLLKAENSLLIAKHIKEIQPTKDQPKKQYWDYWAITTSYYSMLYAAKAVVLLKGMKLKTMMLLK